MDNKTASHYHYKAITRKSSCVNARGIPPAVWWLPLLLSYLGTPPGRVPPGREPPPPWLDLAGYPPPGVWAMAFWEMLQSIMGYGYPPPCGQTDWWKDRHVSKHYLPVVLHAWAVTTMAPCPYHARPDLVRGRGVGPLGSGTPPSLPRPDLPGGKG